MSSLRCMRPDLPAPSSFTVSQLPHIAKLDQNEAPLDLPDALKAELLDELRGRAWNRYPQPAQYVAAKSALAEVAGVDPDSVCLTVGGDQTILSAFYIAGGPGRYATWDEPTYPYIPHAAMLTHTQRAVPGGPAPCLRVFVAPDNPTGQSPADTDVDEALSDERRLVFIDEAYADFAGRTRIADVAGRDNLMIGRSLSKAALADVRLGFVVAHPDIVGALERLYTAPYHLNALQLVVAGRYADIRPHVEASAQAVVAERERVFDALTAMRDIEPRPSLANFILFRVEGEPARAVALYERLAREGVRVRNVGGLPSLEGHLRVTIGTAAENDAFLAALRAA